MLDTTSDSAVRRVVMDGGARITGINGTTRDRVMSIVQTVVASGMERGLGAAQIADELEASLDDAATFGEYRSELIARTETMMAYNGATLTSYTGYGVEKVQAIDGDQDEVCAARNLKVMSVMEAFDITDHPNGTLDWVPVISEPIRNYGPRVPAGIPTRPLPPSRPTIAPAPRVQTAPPPKPVVHTPATPPPSVPMLSAETKPVSDAFGDAFAKIAAQPLAARNPAYRKVVGKIEDALRTIDRTFRDGNLRPMVKVGPLTNMRSSVQGAYWHTGPTPAALEFRVGANMETVFHEISHYIDHLGIGFRDLFGSRLGFARARGEWDAMLRQFTGGDLSGFSAADMDALAFRADIMEPIAKAIDQSAGYRYLQDALARGSYDWLTPSPTGLASVTSRVDADTARWIRYATKPEEVFARAMAQYLTKRHGASAIADIEERIYSRHPLRPSEWVTTPTGERVVRGLNDQWAWDDFAPIDAAITEMLRRVGWLL